MCGRGLPTQLGRGVFWPGDCRAGNSVGTNVVIVRDIGYDGGLWRGEVGGARLNLREPNTVL